MRPSGSSGSGSSGSSGPGARPARGLRLLARLVPRERRGEWLREWEAERREGIRAGRSPVSVYAAAVEDAVALRRRWVASGSLTLDLRFALRSLGRRPGFASVVILTLALGLGANVAVLSAVRGVLLRPLPWDDPGSLALVSTAFTGQLHATAYPVSVPEYFDLRAEHPAFRELAAYWVDEANLTVDGAGGASHRPRRITEVTATANLLGVLGLEVVRGRDLAPGEDRPGADRVALLGHALWLEGLGGDPEAVGRTVRVDGEPHTLVGILPPDFEVPGVGADVVTAVHLDPVDPGGRSSHWLRVVGRLREGTDLSGARLASRELMERWARVHPDRHNLSVDGHPLAITGVREAVAGEVGPPLALLSGAVLLVLLVACVNVANLLLVRGEDRSREFGIRVAVGAGRGALLRQLLVESALLSGAGGLLGVAGAAGALALLQGPAGGILPPNAALRMDGTVLAGAAVLVLGVSLVFGLLPGWSLRSGATAGALRASGPGATAGRRRLALRRLLVGAQVAAAVALLAGAGVLGRSFVRLMEVETGFDARGVVLFDLELDRSGYPDDADVAAFHRELRERGEALPGVAAVGTIRSAPLAGEGGWETVAVEGEAPPAEGDGRSWTLQYQVVDPGVFRALGVPVLEGRSLAARDGPDSTPVAVVNRAAARALWGGAEPLGRRVRLGGLGESPNPWMTVVGVVGDARQTALDREPPPQLFVPRAQAGAVHGGLGMRLATVVARTDGDPRGALAALSGLVREMDPRLPVASPRTLVEQIHRSVGDRRAVALVMGAFSASAAALGIVGLYGLMAWVVGRRAREIGIRYALGAGRRQVVGRIVAEAGLLVAGGALLGVAVAWVGGGLLGGLVYGVSPRDPLVLVGAPLALLAAGLVAAWIPARRASGVDPARVLRAE